MPTGPQKISRSYDEQSYSADRHTIQSRVTGILLDCSPARVRVVLCTLFVTDSVQLMYHPLFHNWITTTMNAHVVYWFLNLFWNVALHAM